MRMGLLRRAGSSHKNPVLRAFRGHTSPTAELTRLFTGYLLVWVKRYVCVAATLPWLIGQHVSGAHPGATGKNEQGTFNHCEGFKLLYVP